MRGMRGIQNYFLISLTNNRIIKFLYFLMKINIKLLIFSIINEYIIYKNFKFKKKIILNNLNHKIHFYFLLSQKYQIFLQEEMI